MDDLQRRARWHETRNGRHMDPALEQLLHRYLGYLVTEPHRRDYWEQQVALVRRLMAGYGRLGHY
jgi:hypothetical protein